MPIVDLRMSHVGPFEDIALAFDEHINVFVGPNSSGKSTTLMALANTMAYPFVLPKRLLRQNAASFTARFVGRHGQTQELAGRLPFDHEAPEYRSRCAPFLAGLGYSTFVPALRQSTVFRTNGPVGTTPGAETPELPEELRRRRTLLPTDDTLIRDAAFLERMVELSSRATQRNDPTLRQLLGQIAAIASEILEAFPVTFWGIAGDRDGFFPQFRTRDGDVAFNVFSQGTQSVLQWLAYVLLGYAKYYGYATNFVAQPGVLIIDEIDAHLHPAAQQRIIPTLQRHFPKLQLFCSTHSPLMLAGLKPGQIHLLQRDSQGTVRASRNQDAIVGYSTDTLLQQFFGIAPSVQ